MDAATLAGLLAEEDRRRVTASLILGSVSIEEVGATTQLAARQVVTALGRLVAGGLVEEIGGRYTVVAGAFAEAARASRPAAAAERPGDEGQSADAAKVWRAFVRDGQLLSIPATRSKRLVILARLAQLFEPGIRYPEREVNDRLRGWHLDTAALRRYLVDEDFLSRDHGEYWRSGGPT